MKNFILRLKHRTVLGEKQNLMQREQNILSRKKRNHLTSNAAATVYRLGLTLLNPAPAQSIPSQIENTPTQTDTFIFYLYTHRPYKTDRKDINSKKSSLAEGCGESEAAESHPHTNCSEGGNDSRGKIRAISLQNTHIYTHTHKQFHTPAVQWW